MSLMGSVSSNPRQPRLAADPPRDGDTDPIRFAAIKDPVLRSAFTAAYDAWERLQDQLSLWEAA